jgi:ribonuclease Y
MPPLFLPLLVTLALGIAAGYFVRYIHALSKKNSLELDIKQRKLEAEAKALSVIEEAEKKAEAIASEAKANRKHLEEKLEQKETRLDKREEILDERQIDIDSQKESLQEKVENIRNIKNQLDTKAASIESELEVIAGLSKEEALERVIKTAEIERAEDLRARLEKLDRAGTEAFEAKATNLLLGAIHRIGNNLPTNIMTSHVEITSDDLKGKVIGKEGRNVRAFERATGVDVLIDESPGYVVLSSFDPVRREIARVAMEALIKDGRIQPAKIEEEVTKAKQEVAKTIKKMGEKAAYEAQVPNLHPDLVTILGRLHFRTSYGQNVLWHSVEMSNVYHRKCQAPT